LEKPGSVTQHLGNIEWQRLASDPNEDLVQISGSHLRGNIFKELQSSGMLGSVVKWAAIFYPGHISKY
jgi:hypothetical protein